MCAQECECCDAAKTECALPSCFTMEFARHVVRATFNHTGFRGCQAACVECLLRGKDAVLVMPTGGGKSLVYQVSAIVQQGLTVVVCPLVALVHDQAQICHGKLAAATFVGSMCSEEKDSVLDACQSGSVHMLFTTPEAVSISKRLRRCLLHLHAEERLRRVVFDEAHCIHAWGSTFRPLYSDAANIRAVMPGVPMLACTATASPAMVSDIVRCLQLSQDVHIFRDSMLRANVMLKVISKPPHDGAIGQAVDLVRASSGCCIVYTRTKADTHRLSQAFDRVKVKAHAYHGDLTDAEKANALKDWLQGVVRVMCATVAFGMGINKSNVRLVLHWNMPATMADLAQQMGRAGRDGKAAQCFILFSRDDVAAAKQAIRNARGSTHAQTVADLEALQLVERWCYTAKCRHVLLLNEFGEDASNCKSACDNCIQMYERFETG